MPSVNDSPFQITVEGQKRGSVQWREVMRLMDTYLSCLNKKRSLCITHLLSSYTIEHRLCLTTQSTKLQPSSGPGSWILGLRSWSHGPYPYERGYHEVETVPPI
ncbi:High-affinity fructose transporter ght6 [Fusarium oxysporum f. sp. albedinis]|nr:High-affinity fructose transporter ght6 [Fusarium oxysporum f. sp. albedinis]